jgi:4'-phosphopantetheinyl transferase
MDFSADRRSSLRRALSSGEVHLWVWQDDGCFGCQQASKMERCLAAGERAAMARLKFEHVRHEYLISKALLRNSLSVYADRDPRDWRFERNLYGKPALAASLLPWPLCFNVSHTDGLVVCAVAWEGDIGVDVEAVDDGTAERDCARTFAAAERAALERDRRNGTASRFFDYWTLKEAYLKAWGVGLAAELDTVVFGLGDTSGLTVQFNDEQADTSSWWSFALMAPPTNHRCALARRSPRRTRPGLRLLRGFSGGQESCEGWGLIASGGTVVVRDLPRSVCLGGSSGHKDRRETIDASNK